MLSFLMKPAEGIPTAKKAPCCLMQDASYSDTSGDRREVHPDRPGRRDRRYRFPERVCCPVPGPGRYWEPDHSPDPDRGRFLERDRGHYSRRVPQGVPAEDRVPDHPVPVSRPHSAADRSDGRGHSFPDGGVLG